MNPIKNIVLKSLIIQYYVEKLLIDGLFRHII